MSDTLQFQAIQQFRFQEQFQAIRSMVDQSGEPWFVAQDVCDILEHTNSRMAIQSLDDDEKGVSKVYTSTGEKEVNIINESGLYNLIFRSNKPQAKTFRKWVTSEVLPAIRKHGHYGASRQAKIPTDPQQAWALCALLVHQEQVLAAQLRTIRKNKAECMARLLNNAPQYLIPELDQAELGLSL